MKLAALAAAVALLVVAPRAHATRLADTPCKGCVASVPASVEAGPTPLLVLLHGDSGHSPKQLVDAWERATAARGIALLALACPRDLGCEGSYWRWNGDPAWLGAQVRALGSRVAIDPRRVWLLGWSGGASYLGYRLPELGEGFAAVVFHGGGIPPGSSTCATRPLPTYFLVGDKNPLHGLAVRLRDDATRCAHDVTWDLVRGADHAGEWNARAPHAETLLAWLEAHPAPAPVPAPSPAPVPDPERTPTPPRPTPGPSTTTAAPAPPLPRSGCATSPGAVPPLAAHLLAPALALALLARRRLTSRASARDRG